MSVRVPDERLDEMAALAEKATPGPWVPSLFGVLRRDSRGTTYMDTADAAFIAAAGTDLAALVADLRAARADNQRLREALENIVAEVEPHPGIMWLATLARLALAEEPRA